MGDNPGGILGMIGGVFEKLSRDQFNDSINKAETSNKPGPEKKQTVLNELLDFLGVSGLLRLAITWVVGFVIDTIVGEKNASGEFTHSD